VLTRQFIVSWLLVFSRWSGGWGGGTRSDTENINASRCGFDQGIRRHVYGLRERDCRKTKAASTRVRAKIITVLFMFNRDVCCRMRQNSD